METLNSSFSQPLLPSAPKLTIWQRLQKCFKRHPKCEPRVVRVQAPPPTRIQPTNMVSNTKYNILTFLPIVLFNQFKFFQNFFFLMMALTQFIPALKVGLIFTYFAPLMFVLTITMAKQAFEDLKRYYRDRKANSTKYNVLNKSGFERIQSRLLRVGDIVQIQSGQIVPADMILLSSDSPEGTLFVKTDQLDGQTDWKMRKATKLTQKLVKEKGQEDLLAGYITCEVGPPSDKIYQFSGILTCNDKFEEQHQKLSVENCLWASCSVASGRGISLVIYCAKQTRIKMGTDHPRQKIGLFDLQVNRLSKVLFLTMLTVATALILCQRPHGSEIPNQFIRKLILVSYIFPLSVKVNLQLVRLVYSSRIGKDKAMPGAIARNSNVAEQMGRIKYLLSDKTGTLTQNDMMFRRMAAGKDNYEYEQLKRSVLATQANNMLRAIGLCNNVTVIETDGVKRYQGASPDEVTLVQTANQLGVSIITRTQSEISIATKQGQEDYQIMHNFHFSSERKRMGILLHSRKQKQCVFFMKGADSVMETLIEDQRQKDFVRDYCSQQASFGLRTLVFAFKVLSEGEAEQWMKKYRLCDMKLQIDTQELDKCVDQLEKGLSYLGVSCLEDKLQEQLRPTLESLRAAGIKIWMVTGDKRETAECISIASGMRMANNPSVTIEDITSASQLTNELKKFHTNGNQVMAIDGKSLSFVISSDKKTRDKFFDTAMNSQCVICYRCSPAQKGDLVKSLKQSKRTQGDRVAAIGDGGNDVGMIQNADVGIGLSGRQGKQAALAADFSLERFMHISKLLLWHGRMSYKRSAIQVQYIIYRGMLIGAMHAAFIATFSFVSIALFHSTLQAGYTTFFTFLPTFAIVLDEDVSPTVARQYPELYRSVQKGNQLTLVSFASWSFIAVFQAIGIFIPITLLFQDHHIDVQTFSFIALILAQYLVNLSQMHRINYLSIMAILISMGLFIGSMFFLKEKNITSYVSFDKLLLTLGIVAATWLPIVLIQFIRRTYDPQDYQKVMMRQKRILCLQTPILTERNQY